MISISVTGVDGVLETIRRIGTSVNTASAYEEVCQQFSARLRAATPVGYSGTLGDSVVYEVSDESGVVGYEAGVETAGEGDPESVLRLRTRGQSVLAKNWVKPSELEAILQDSLAEYQQEGAALIESRLSDGIP